MPINFNDTPENILNALEQIVTEIEDRLNVYADKPVEQTSFSQIILSLEKSDCCAPCEKTPTGSSCDGYTDTLIVYPDLYYRTYGEEESYGGEIVSYSSSGGTVFPSSSGDVVISSSVVVPPPSSNERIVWSIEVDGKDTGLNTGTDDYIEDVVMDNSGTLGFTADYISSESEDYLVFNNITDAVKKVRLIPNALPFRIPQLRENPTATVDPATGIISFCIGKTEGEVPSDISCEGATNTSGCVLWLETVEEGESTIDLEVDGVKVLSNASKTDLETYLFNNDDIENDLTFSCGCPNGYVRSVYVPYHRYTQGQTLYLPVSLKPNGQSITTPFTVQGTTQSEIAAFISNTLNSQLEPYGLYCVYGLFASNNIYLGVPDNRAKFNYKDTEFYILDAGNTFTSGEIPRGLPPCYCWMPS